MKRPLPSGIARNRMLYGAALAVVLAFTWVYGGETLYLSLYVLLLLPALSFLLTLVMLRGLCITQRVSHSVLVKEEPGAYTIQIDNNSPMLFARIECEFVERHFAIVTDGLQKSLFARPFSGETHEIPFRIKYRGEYPLGIRRIKVRDLTGLFTVKRKLRDTVSLTVLPRVTDLAYFPLAANLFSQSHSNFEIREEDYSVVSDIRAYRPTDSVKRIHWKLTAKRQELLVKNFQSNSLNQITVILDTTKFYYAPELTLAMEDTMVEFTLGLLHYCLLHAMPVAFLAGDYVKKEGRTQSDFDGMYHMAANIPFDAAPIEQRALGLLGKCIDESQHYINAVVATAKPDEYLYGRVVSANHTGHFVAVVYFSPPKTDAAAEEVYRKLTDSGVACYRVGLEVPHDK
jgi:uncharacterized protein (DUF58 family)